MMHEKNAARLQGWWTRFSHASAPPSNIVSIALLLLLCPMAETRADLVPSTQFIPPERKEIEKVLLQEVSFSVDEVESQTSLMPISKAPAAYQESVWKTMLILDRSTETNVALLEVREKDLEAAKKLKDYLVKYQGARPDALLISIREENDRIPGEGRMIVHFAEDPIAHSAGAEVMQSPWPGSLSAANSDQVALSQAAAVPPRPVSVPVESTDPWPSPFTGKPRRTRITESLAQAPSPGATDAQVGSSASGDKLSLSQASAVRADESSAFLSAIGVSTHGPSWEPSRLNFNLVPEFATAETFRGEDISTRQTGVWLRARGNMMAEVFHRPIAGIGPELDFAQSLAAFSGEGRTLNWWEGFAGFRTNLRANTRRYWIPNLGLSLGVTRMNRSGLGEGAWISGYEGLESRITLNLPIDGGFLIGLDGSYMTGRTDANERFRMVGLGAHLDQELGFGIHGSEVRARLGASASLRGASSQQETVTTVMLGFVLGML